MMNLAQKNDMDISDDQAVVHIRTGAHIEQAMKIIEPPGFVVAYELHVVDMAEHVAIAPTRRRGRKKFESLTQVLIDLRGAGYGHSDCFQVIADG
jgi:hypothetical protein